MPAAVAISSSTAWGAVPSQTRKRMLEGSVFWAMKMMNCFVKEMKYIPGKQERNFLIEKE